MKKEIIYDILALTAFAGVAYFVAKRYHDKKVAEREARQSLHFQIF